MTIKTLDVILAMAADTPLPPGNAVAILADFGRSRKDHLRLIGVIWIIRPVASLAGNRVLRHLFGLLTMDIRVALEALHIFIAQFPLGQE